MKTLQPAHDVYAQTLVARSRISCEMRQKAAAEIHEAKESGRFMVKIAEHPHFADASQLDALLVDLKGLGYAVSKTTWGEAERPALLVSWRQPRETPTS
jgi:hypothetical protein